LLTDWFNPSTTLGTSARGSDDHPNKPKPGLPGTPTDDHPNKPKPGLPGTPTDAAKTTQHKVLRLRSGFRFGLHLRAGSAGSRSAKPLRQAQGHTRKTAQQRSFDFAQDFACGFPARLNASLTTRKTAQQRSFDFAQDFACGFPARLNASLTTRKTAQLYKKRGSFRNSARCLDYTEVRCLRITLRIAFRSASFR